MQCSTTEIRWDCEGMKGTSRPPTYLEHLLLDGVLGDEASGVHRPSLANPVGSVNSLWGRGVSGDTER